MKKTLTLLLTLLLAAPLFADESLRSVQAELKSQGFYYGDATGQTSPETAAALRRYQIRHGLEVTGTVNKETLGSLGLGPAVRTAPPAAAPRPPQATPPPAPKPEPRAPKPPPVEESDREFLEREQAQRRTAPPPSYLPPPQSRDPGVIRPPAPSDPPGDDFPVLFAHTPYASAPRQVQQRTLRDAQATLASRGFYRDIVDGYPGPATEEALLSYQRARRLPLTGRLDLETLSSLRLLPSRNFTREPASPPTQRVYRGIWVN
ncbi:MAG: peptidoglycan-binding protein [Chthoniobacter sp.]|nr:peptidoglycan-binding protein [Chthoniobacter sp.]